MLVIEEGYEPHILDGTKILQESCNEVSSGSIESTWIKEASYPAYDDMAGVNTAGVILDSSKPLRLPTTQTNR